MSISHHTLRGNETLSLALDKNSVELLVKQEQSDPRDDPLTYIWGQSLAKTIVAQTGRSQIEHFPFHIIAFSHSHFPLLHYDTAYASRACAAKGSLSCELRFAWLSLSLLLFSYFFSVPPTDVQAAETINAVFVLGVARHVGASHHNGKCDGSFVLPHS